MGSELYKGDRSPQGTPSDTAFENVHNFYKTHYPLAEISVCNSTESELMKIFVNCFYSVKIQILNEFYLLCKKLNVQYDTVKNLMLKNKWINENHTKVPGTDGILSYGGMCFPKDTNALNEMMKTLNINNAVLDATITERNKMRNDHCNIK